MNPPEQVKYSRKEFAATLNLLAVDGVAYEERNAEIVTRFNSTFFKEYPTHPDCLYWVMDTTKGEDVGRGFVFLTFRGWGYIIRQDKTFYWCPFPSTSGIAYAIWGTSRSQATAYVIRQSRASWDRGNPNTEAQQRRVYQHFNKPCRDREVLGLPPNFTHDELKRSYRQLCLKHHPDHGGNTAKFRELNEAYKRLISIVR